MFDRDNRLMLIKTFVISGTITILLAFGTACIVHYMVS
jgi:hypothetical protein